MVQPPDDNSPIRVPPSILRQRFNNSELGTLIEAGLLEPTLQEDRHLEHPERLHEEFCTRHQWKRYVDADGEIIVETSNFLRPDGSLGASGRPDPKRMRVGDRLWVLGDETDPVPPF